MALEFDYNPNDYQLIASKVDSTLLPYYYVRITLYIINEGNRVSDEIYQYSVITDDTNINTKKAVFYSSLNSDSFRINVSPFETGVTPLYRLVGGQYNDFKITVYNKGSRFKNIGGETGGRVVQDTAANAGDPIVFDGTDENGLDEHDRLLLDGAEVGVTLSAINETAGSDGAVHVEIVAQGNSI